MSDNKLRDELADDYQTKYLLSNKKKTYDEIKNAVQFGWDARQAEIDKLRAALEFYACNGTYEKYGTSVLEDAGAIAREALGRGGK